MASSIPEQYRAVDPFASYNSNTVNQLTEMVSRADNVLDTPCGLDVTSDGTSQTTVAVQPGYCYKDDVMITVTEEHIVDFTDSDHYTFFDDGFNEAGYYYIVLEYTYVKSRPAPEAKIKIVKPSQRSNYSYDSAADALLFLKAVNIIWSGSEFVIDSLYDYDPTITDNKRNFARTYVGGVTPLPTHDSCRDKGRIVYDIVNDEFYFGYAGGWIKLNEPTAIVDTTNVTAGDLCYVDSAGQAAAAIVTSIDTAAEMVAISIGVSGQAVLIGEAQDVNVESTSPAIAVGDLLYLSETEAGSVTSTQPSPLYQVVGRATSAESGSKVDILFFGRAVQEATGAAKVVDTLSGGDWNLSGGSYYGDVDISDLNISNQEVVVSCKDSSNLVISPEDVDLSVADTVRIWMPVNTETLVVTVVG